MENPDILNLQEPESSPSFGTKLILIAGVILRLIGFVIVGGIVAIFVTVPLFGFDLKPILSGTGLPLENKLFLISLQGMNQLFTFLILPGLYVYFFKKDLIDSVKPKWKNFGTFSLLAILIMLFGLPLINVVIEWNKAIKLPSFLHDIEVWMQTKEDENNKLVKVIAYYDNPLEFVLSLFAIGILPAIGEEFLFRGVMQNEFKQITRNPHFAIWFCGIIFSALHLQFYGFFPRMLLGVLFGYMYFWSGTLLVPILVHFFNNVLTFIMFNLYKNKVINIDPESSESLPWYSLVISFVIFVLLLLTFKKTGTKREA